jgi:hypothetical protein
MFINLGGKHLWGVRWSFWGLEKTTFLEDEYSKTQTKHRYLNKTNTTTFLSIVYIYYNAFTQSIARQRLDEHPAIRARNNRTNVIARC